MSQPAMTHSHPPDLPNHVVDVAVVYAQYATGYEQGQTHTTPFPTEGRFIAYNDTYAFFLDVCREKGLSAVFTTTEYSIGPGQFSAYWTWNGTEWQWYEKPVSASVLFNKMTPITPEQQAVFDKMTAAPHIQTFKSLRLHQIIGNKLSVYHSFPQYAIPSVALPMTPEGFAQAKQELRQLIEQYEHKDDCSDRFVVKGLDGAGGDSVFAIDAETSFAELETRAQQYPAPEYMIQPMIRNDQSKLFGYTGHIDFRITLFKGKMIRSYIRIAKEGDFRANVKQGGRIVYIPPSRIPRSVLTIVEDLSRQLPTEHALYSLDFIRGASGQFYLVEGNDSPGIILYNNKDKKKKELIYLIVDELVFMVKHPPV